MTDSSSFHVGWVNYILFSCNLTWKLRQFLKWPSIIFLSCSSGRCNLASSSSGLYEKWGDFSRFGYELLLDRWWCRITQKFHLERFVMTITERGYRHWKTFFSTEIFLTRHDLKIKKVRKFLLPFSKCRKFRRFSIVHISSSIKCISSKIQKSIIMILAGVKLRFYPHLWSASRWSI